MGASWLGVGVEAVSLLALWWLWPFPVLFLPSSPISVNVSCLCPPPLAPPSAPPLGRASAGEESGRGE